MTRERRRALWDFQGLRFAFHGPMLGVYAVQHEFIRDKEIEVIP